MSIFSILIIAFGGAFGVLWLLNYVPLKATIFGFQWSPRLVLCHLLAPFDAIVTFLMTFGAWFGFGIVTGIFTAVFSILSGIGISMGILVAKKWIVPKWEIQYKEEVEYRK